MYVCTKTKEERAAFTLAEVLITLGIIGVVAAMTIPGLINSYNKKITETRLAKFYSLFNQAIKLSIVENDDPESWSEYWAAGAHYANEDGSYVDRSDVINNGFDKYLRPYMKIMHTKKVKDKVLYYLADGSAFAYNQGHLRDISFYPKNAERCLTLNNRSGSCEFFFIFYPIEEKNTWKWHYQKGLEPYMYNWDGTKETLLSDCKIKGNFCTKIIKENGWEIPSNYPRKIQY